MYTKPTSIFDPAWWKNYPSSVPQSPPSWVKNQDDYFWWVYAEYYTSMYGDLQFNIGIGGGAKKEEGPFVEPK